MKQQQQQQQVHKSYALMMAVALAGVVALASVACDARPDGMASGETLARPQPRVIQRRSSDHAHPKSMMHNHLSRKVFDRACAASKDSIDEIVACLTNSEVLVKTIKEETAKNCYKDSFNADFDPKEVTKHKELICNNRDKFEEMTACVYKKTSEAMDPKQLDKFTESLVDVGLCIINALDG